ncbi:MAG: zf-HC2 domain-containing protein [Methylotenera sp.]|jgi:Putative zinc-finger
MMNCKQASQLISRGLDVKLSKRERFALKLHLLMCKYCSRFRQQLMVINVTISKLGKQIEGDSNIRLPEETKTRIVKALKSDAK